MKYAPQAYRGGQQGAQWPRTAVNRPGKHGLAPQNLTALHLAQEVPTEQASTDVLFSSGATREGDRHQ